MAERYTIQYLRDCRGIDTSLPDEQIPDNCLAYGTENVMPYTGGRYNLVKRWGIKQIYLSANVRTLMGSMFSGLFDSYYTDHGTQLDICSYDGTVLSTVATTYIGAPCWRSFASKDLVVCPAFAAKTADGDTFEALPNIPAGATAIEEYNRHLFCIGHSLGSVRWSAIGDPETWSAANEYLFDLGTDEFYGLRRNDTDLVVFADTSFYVLNGFGPTFQVIAVNRSIGSRSNPSIVNTPYGMFFWSREEGLARIRGSYYDIDLVTRRKLPTLNTRTYTTITSVYLAKDKCVRVYCFDTVGFGGYRIDYYPETDEIYYHTGRGTAMTCGMTAGGELYLGGHIQTSTGAYYMEIPQPYDVVYDSKQTDDGTTIIAKIVCKRMAAASPATYKIVNTVMPQVQLSTVTSITGSVSLKVFSDNNATTPAREFVITPANVGIIEEKYGVNLFARKFQVQLNDDITGAAVFYNLVTEAGTVSQDV
jgi:hypothetical protein